MMILVFIQEKNNDVAVIRYDQNNAVKTFFKDVVVYLT